MKLLILGGGVFLGRAVLDAALRSGHDVTVFNRGRARSHWPEGVEALQGDRARDLSALAGRHWDAVIDTCGYVPNDVIASTAALRTSGAYLFVSSISALASFAHAPVMDTDAVADASDADPADRSPALYGVQKAACEAAVQRAFGMQALIVRPGLIVGPGDPTGRFSHWPWRVAAGGEMLVPEAPADAPLQFIDVRDLGDWLVRLLEHGARGVFNATGPVTASACTWNDLLAASETEAAARGITPANRVPIDEDFLIGREVSPWIDLPLWLPANDAEHLGFMRVDVGRATDAGLVTRPLRETVAAVLDEGLPAADDKRRTGPLRREREAELIAAWRARASAALGLNA